MKFLLVKAFSEICKGKFFMDFNTIKAYGVNIRNVPVDITNTVAYQELNQVWAYGAENIVIDAVRADTANRPELVKLIETLGHGDRIDLYSIDTLLMGDNRKAIEYYEAIIKKGIDLLVYDFTGAVAKISPFSTIRMGISANGEDLFVKSDISPDMLVENLRNYIANTKPEKNSGGFKDEGRAKLSDAFRDIYFAYEGYRLRLEETLFLLSELCGISSKITFWLASRDFEATIDYSEFLDMYSTPTSDEKVFSFPELLELPKRCGGLPDEYNQIISYIETNLPHIQSKKEQLLTAYEALNFFANDNVFLRWQLLDEKVKKPRPKEVDSKALAEKILDKHKKHTTE